MPGHFSQPGKELGGDCWSWGGSKHLRSAPSSVPRSERLLPSPCLQMSSCCLFLLAGCLARAECLQLSIMTLKDQICPNEMIEAVGSGSDTPSRSYVPEIFLIYCRARERGPFPIHPFAQFKLAEEMGVTQELLCSP